MSKRNLTIKSLEEEKKQLESKVKKIEAKLLNSIQAACSTQPKQDHMQQFLQGAMP